MGEKEGFTEHLVKRCGGCKYHSQFMVRSGRDPMYRHFCNNKLVDAPEWDKNIYGNNEKGRSIGEADYTPNWCPFLNQKK